MRTDPDRAEPWYTKNNMLFRKVRYVFGFGCWCCGYETQWQSPWDIDGKYPKWCMYCKFAQCSVCSKEVPKLSFKERIVVVLTPEK